MRHFLLEFLNKLMVRLLGYFISSLLGVVILNLAESIQCSYLRKHGVVLLYESFSEVLNFALYLAVINQICRVSLPVI